MQPEPPLKRRLPDLGWHRTKNRTGYATPYKCYRYSITKVKSTGYLSWCTRWHVRPRAWAGPRWAVPRGCCPAWGWRGSWGSPGSRERGAAPSAGCLAGAAHADQPAHQSPTEKSKGGIRAVDPHSFFCGSGSVCSSYCGSGSIWNLFEQITLWTWVEKDLTTQKFKTMQLVQIY